MLYRNSEMKIDQLVGYLNEDKINLAPAFQRGHVWKLPTRRKLVRNIVLGKPIPAVFLYKEASGSKYSYNILDGKQRLESLMLFIANKRIDFVIAEWDKYFFGESPRRDASFAVDLDGGKKTFAELSDEQVRELREYSIPTIEITLNEETSLDEVITLFVDINQQGEPVRRFDIVKALCKSDPLLKGVFDLIALEVKRGRDIHYKPKNNEFTFVLKKLQVVSAITSPNSKVDKIWEKLLELALFNRTKSHRSSVASLKEFMAAGEKKKRRPRLSTLEVSQLRRVFKFLKALAPKLGESRLFSDQTHSYTMLTSLLKTDLISEVGEDALQEKLHRLSGYLDKTALPSGQVGKNIKNYLDLSTKQTTHVSRREDRERLFVSVLKSL
ncbi:MAG TPA: DUF262 domain-containing protein [Bryobacteraceae bacterium]|nr:hypothetical protein [Bryobacterales bacterium]HRJ19004.1 DUF262 domain-containing protein [Bryobacteraceae bacterium]